MIQVVIGQHGHYRPNTLNLRIDFKAIMRIITLNIVLLSLFGCASVPTHLDLPVTSEAILKRDYYTVKIPSFDGKTIRATIFQPELKPGETAPVIIHAHGFGMFRMSRPTSLYGNFIFSGIAAKKAWKNGYWMVSFDQRGHGQSEGSIEMMSPDAEVNDLKFLISWIENNIPRLTYEADNPVVGMIGESYGGGVQLMGASLDDRINAIVPITTWHDFSTVLTPNKVVKSGWLTTLVAMGNIMNPTTMNSNLNAAYLKSIRGIIPESFGPMMQSRSLSDACYCQVDAEPRADAFLIQGFKDVLFPINEAVENKKCFEAANRDVRLLGTQNGHLLPMTQFAMSLPGYDVDTEVTCGSQTYRTDDLVLAWFDEKLKNQKGRADIIPKVCLTHDQQSGSVYSEVPRGGDTFTIPATGVESGFAGLFEAPFKVVDSLTSLLITKQNYASKKKAQVNAFAKPEREGLVRPSFVPLYVSTGNEQITGIPIANLSVSGERNDIVFVGVGLQKNGQSRPKLISDQVFPLRGGEDYYADMPAISSQLNNGDVVGLMVAGYSNQYRISSSITTNADVSGSIELPIQSAKKTAGIL